MTHANLTPPDWRQLAAQMIEELRLHHAGRARAVIERKVSAGAQAEEPADSETLDELWSKFHGSTPDLNALPGEEATPVPAREVLTALRIAAAFGSADAILAAQLPDAITVLRDIGVEDLEEVVTVLRHCFPESEWTFVTPSIHDGAVSRLGEAKFHRDIDARLDRPAPTLILLPNVVQLQPHLQHAGLNTFTLAPINGRIILEQVRAGRLSPYLTDDAGFLSALPDDAALARLETPYVIAALRATDLEGVIRNLRNMSGADADSGPRLENMTGDTPALRAAKRLVADLLLWKEGKIRWSELSRSLLLYGPPGTGKTWLARAMGNSAGLNVVSGTFGEWQAAGHLGDMLREMRKTFTQARRLAPCVLIIDEIDAVGSRTDGDRHASNYRANVINAFLAEMDMISREAGVIVIGTCNHVDRIDAAVIRAGRFDHKLEVPLPDTDGLLALLRQHLREDIADHDLRQIAHRAVGRSPAEIDAAIRAARSDARHQRKLLSPAMLRHHLKIDQGGEEPAWLWRVAVHESGHAVIGAALKMGQITGMKITDDGGEVRRFSTQNASLLSDIEAEIACCLAGRAAERLMLGDISAGSGGPAHSDLAMATTHALGIELNYGLGLEGPVWHDAPGAMMMHDSLLRARVRQRIERQERRAGEILAQHRPTLEALARELMQKRSLSTKEIAAHLHTITHPAASCDTDATAQIDEVLEAMAAEI